MRLNKLRFQTISILFTMMFVLISCDNNKTSTDESSFILCTADYLLSQQNDDGAIPDEKNGVTVNMDSNMEYALIGLAAAYWKTNDEKYLKGFEKGINWLAMREEMSDSAWKGSWYYAYSSSPPYKPIETPLGPNILDVRGVDATSALFVYLLFLDRAITGTNTLVNKYKSNAKSALDFIISHNQSPNGFFYSSWQKFASDNKWHIFDECYSSDQGDVYLGLQAGYMLYGTSTYEQNANFLKQNTCITFFSQTEGRYAVGIDSDGNLDLDENNFDIIFPQGYLPWVFGKNNQNDSSYIWLSNCQQEDGSLICYTEDPEYSLSVAIYLMSAFSLSHTEPSSSINWIKNNTFDPNDGGITDNYNPDSEKYSNVQGFSIVAILKFPNLL